MMLRIGGWARHGVWLAVVLWLTPSLLVAQTRPWPGSTPAERPPAGPAQPAAPRYPQLQQRPAPPQKLPPGFPLTPQQEAYLDQVLDVWERCSMAVKTFESSFTRWEYDPVFGPAKGPRYVEYGKLKYAAPDRGMFQVTHTDQDGKAVAIAPAREEHWICDGKSIFEYNYVKKQLIQHKLPPSLQGQAIADGPLPFLFGAEAAKLKQRYLIRVIPSPPGRQGETWLEAWPRLQRDAADFRRAELILTNKDVMPMGLHLYLPNGKNHTAYQFHNIVTNHSDPLRFFKGDPFRAPTPFGWKKIVEEPPTQQASRPSGDNRGRGIVRQGARSPGQLGGGNLVDPRRRE